MNISPLPPAIESRKCFVSMIAEEDWLAELNARLEHLQAISGGPTED